MNEGAVPDVLTPRARRAVALIALALVVMAASGAVYLWRSAAHPYNGPAPPATSLPVLVTMTATSDKAAWVLVHDSGGPESVLFHTEDGGASWRRQLSTTGLGVLQFADGRRGVLLNWPGARFETAGIPQVYRTDDAGANWRSLNMPRLAPGYSADPFFLDPDHAFVLATRPGVPGGELAQELTLWRTDDGGRRWEPLVNVDAAHLRDHGLSGADQLADVSFQDRDTGWIMGRGAAAATVVYVTHDGGRQWSRARLPVGAPGPAPQDWLYLGDPAVSAGGQGMMSVFDRDANQNWLLRTADGGDSWTSFIPAPTAGQLNVAMVDSAVGWAADGTGAWVTADSGRNWSKSEALPERLSLGMLAPVTASVAWAEGLAFEPRSMPTPWTLFRTSDAGKHWTRVAVPSLT